MTRTITIGASYAAGSSMVSPYSDGGFEPGATTTTTTIVGGQAHDSHTFTNTSGGNRSVREVQFNDGTITYGRVVLDITAMPNFCIVPNGASVTIECITIAYATTAVLATIDTSTFTNAAAIHYNGNPLPNASITGISPIYGGQSWTFRCYTELQSEIDALQVFACPMEVGISITGQQYVKSAIPSGTLFIKNLTTRAKVSYENCFIQSIDIEPMLLSSGLLGQWFNVTVVQSAYADTVA